MRLGVRAARRPQPARSRERGVPQFAMASRRANLLSALALLCLSSAHGTVYTVTDQVYMDVSIGGDTADRVVLGLFGEVAPKTVRNFLAFASEGVDGHSYKGSRFHRVIRKFMIQGGDVVKHDGTGSLSLYGESFDDETFKVKHTAPGMISMANAGKNTNGCQFFITTVPTPWLDNLHVAFGKVVQGMATVHKIENLATDADDRPLRPVVIEQVGVLPTPQSFTVSDEPYDIWEWIRGASVPLAFSFSILAFFHWMIRKLDIATADDAPVPAIKSKARKLSASPSPAATLTSTTNKLPAEVEDTSDSTTDQTEIRKRK